MANKKLVLICAVILCNNLCGLVSAQNDSTNPATEPNSLQTSNAWFNADFDIDPAIGPQQSSVKRFAYVVSVVVLLGVAAYYVTKKLLPKLAVTQGKNISIIESVHLGPHKQLHLIRIGEGRKLLIGSTTENINTLADVTETFQEHIQPDAGTGSGKL